MNLKLTFLSLAAILSSSLASAQLKNINGNAEVTKVEEANKQISSMQCQFSRTTKIAALKDATKADGDFYFAAPSNLAMKYANGELLVVTNDNVSMTVGGKTRTLRSSNRHVEDLSATLLACVKGNISAIDGTLKSAKANGQAITFKIDANMKVGRSSINAIELSYNKKDCTLNSLKLIEPDGSYQLYELKTKTLNSTIDSATFSHPNTKKRR